ncbi:MAG: phage tail tape measure protein [Candidatus Kaistia colombiensis]|nr:MAG: phage tail tape measure protein [Kaistia sp.]
MGSSTVSELIVRLKDETSKQAAQVAGALDQISKAESGIQSAKMKALTDELTKAEAAAKNVSVFREAQEKLKQTRRQFNEAKTAVENTAKMLAAAGEGASQKMQTALRRAQSEVKKTATAYDSAAAQAKAAFADIGGSVQKVIGAEERLRTEINKTTEAIKAQAAADDLARVQAGKRQQRRDIVGGAASIAGVYVGYKTREFGKDAIVSAADFDIGVRRQRAYTGTSQADQDNLLIPQAKRIGQETQFSNLDIVESQTSVMQRLPPSLPRAKVAYGITEEVKNYALAMQADMKTSAEGITAFLQQTQKDISTQEKAVKEARRATNMMIRMAKIGGMSDEDIQNYFSYAGPSATIAGLSDTTLGALGVGLRRSGFKGDVAGVALRSFSSKLVAPTKKGLASLDSMGINFDDYTSAPEKMTTEAISGAVRRNFGKNISAEVQAAIEEALDNPDIVGDRGEFTSAMVEALAPEFGGDKMGAKDRNSLAKVFGDYHKLSVGSVDTEGLLMAILASNPSLAQLNAFFTDKHGGKAGVLASNLGQVAADKALLSDTPDNYGTEIAAEIMGGLGGSFERLKGSVENVTLAMGEANAKWLGYTFEGVGNTIDAFSNLSAPVRQAATALGTLAAGAGFTYGSMKLLGTFFGGGGALTGSALALDGSAAALTRAAIALGGSAAGGAGSGAAAAGTGAVAAGARGTGRLSKALRFGGRLTGWVGAGLTAYELSDYLVQGNAAAAARQDETNRRVDELTARIAARRSSVFGSGVYSGKDFTLGAYDGFRSAHLAGEAGGLVNLGGVGKRRMDAALADLPSANDRPFELSALDQTRAKADAAGEAVDALNKTVTPNVNTQSLDDAVTKARQLRDLLECHSACKVDPISGGIGVQN